MIKLPDIPLPTTAARQLMSWQAEVDALASHTARVEAAKRIFKQRNTPRNRTFAEVRRQLTAMCSGAQRCGYCEDSAADEVEHIRPKDLYPELVFAWRNYLYACGPCNGPKNNQFAVFPGWSRKPVEVSSSSRVPSRPPPKGEPALIDPRGEDPMAFLVLDLQGTFMFEPMDTRGTRDYERADYTRRILRLNRELLTVARAEAFGSYRARLAEYITLREGGASRAALQRRIEAIQLAAHPTVWWEMKRQQRQHRELRALFSEAPEALSW
ncbi:hypothetical protein [Pyxidicoccus trucidator]|uniref:hypothetical protein n=1 Tax=Pyxidicoccus trucidator TaxID=2709662 RepID=UPI001968236A|nr:hypothetical protein [Pyxidicoccus trucidator]